jgi:hypothetical protein
MKRLQMPNASYTQNYQTFKKPTMELDTFISKSLKFIIKGINKSQEFAKEKRARINPHIKSFEQLKMLIT